MLVPKRRPLWPSLTAASSCATCGEWVHISNEARGVIHVIPSLVGAIPATVSISGPAKAKEQ